MDTLAFISRYEAILRDRGIPKMVFYKACGISDAAVSQWRKGRTKPAMTTVSRIADCLGVSVGYLLGEATTTDGVFFSDGTGYGGGSGCGAGFGDGTGYGGPALPIKGTQKETLVPVSVGEKIKLHRMSLGLTQTELGARLGVKKNAVSKWECGRVDDIPTSKIKAMAALFDVTPSYLIDDQNIAQEAEKEMPTPVSESGQSINIVKIAGRDGSLVEKHLSDKEMQALKAFVDLLPDADL